MEKRFVVLISIILCGFAFAQDNKKMFQHKDWELACDNTGTCRAAGYQIEGDGLPASLMIERAAGAKQAVKMFINLHSQDDKGVLEMPNNLKVNNIILKDIGEISENYESLQLNIKTVKKLLELIPNSTHINLHSGKLNWNISLDGAKAMLLKMDDMQQRLGTSGALVSKGTKDESAVPPAKAIKSVLVPKLAITTANDLKLIPILAKLVNQKSCEKAFDETNKQILNDFQIVRLDKNNLVFFHLNCWLAPYNGGGSAWSVADKKPYQLELIDDLLNDYSDGEFSSDHKGRGLGDCWVASSWAWNGQTFEQTMQSTSGSCKGFPGGVWHLPTIVSKVVNLNTKKIVKQ